MSVVEPIFIAAAATDAAVRAAANAALSAGGGTIILPAGTITLTSTLPTANGLRYKGVAPLMAYPDGHPDNGWTYTGGTVLVGDGTFAAFEANITSVGTPPANPAATAITAFGVEDIGFDNFTRAVSIGAHNNIGLLYGTLRNLYISNCTEWAVHLVNFMHPRDLDGIYSILCQNGQYYGVDVDTGVFLPGNARIGELYNNVPHDGRDNRLCRGIVFEATGQYMNEIIATRVQNNAFNRTLLSVSATFSNGSSSIAVPDGTKFAVGLPVIFTATNYGVTANLVYMVQSVSGNNITVGTSKTGATITASGSGSLTLQSYGMPCAELVGMTVGKGLVSSNFLDVDLEGSSTAALYVENVSSTNINLSEVPSTTHVDICARTGTLAVNSRNVAKTDWDSSSSQSTFSGSRGTILQYAGAGHWYDSSLSCQVFNFYTALQGNTGSFQTRQFGFTYPNYPLGRRQFQRDTSISILATNGGSVVFNGASGQTFTLPTIVTDASNPTSSNVGAYFDIINVSANSLTVATDGTQLFNTVAAKTSLTVATQTGLLVEATKTSSGTLFWKATAYSLA